MGSTYSIKAHSWFLQRVTLEAHEYLRAVLNIAKVRSIVPGAHCRTTGMTEHDRGLNIIELHCPGQMNIRSLPSGHAAIFGSMEKVAFTSDLAAFGRLMSFDFASAAHCHVQCHCSAIKIVNRTSAAMKYFNVLSAVNAQRHRIEQTWRVLESCCPLPPPVDQAVIASLKLHNFSFRARSDA